MAQLETLNKKIIQITPEIVLQKVSKYAFHVVTPDNLAKRKDLPLRILIWGHGSLDNRSYEEMVTYTVEEAQSLEKYCDFHNVIAVMPILPRDSYGTETTPPLDAQILSYHTMFQNYDDFYYRPDLEIIKMTESLKGILKKNGYTVAEKMLIGGISAGASLAHRFSTLHPELISARAVLLEGTFMYPEIEINGLTLPYPFGVSNLDQIEGIGIKSKPGLYIPTYLYKGMLDNQEINDPLHYEAKLIDASLTNKIKHSLGITMYERFLHYAEYLTNQGVKVVIDSPKNFGHQLDPATFSKIFDFFDEVAPA